MNFATDTIETPRAYCGEPSLAFVTAAAEAPPFNRVTTAGGSADGATERLLREFGGYCEELFAQLAAEAPTELVDLVRYAALRPADLTFAAEALGAAPAHESVPLLIELLSTHPSALVREGAIYGLLKASATSGRPLLERLTLLDPSAAIRETAASALAIL